MSAASIPDVIVDRFRVEYREDAGESLILYPDGSVRVSGLPNHDIEWEIRQYCRRRCGRRSVHVAIITWA